MRLLLIEDDPMIGSAARRGLMQAGFAVDWVTDGHSAQAAVANAVYDALVLDLGLPGVDGLTLLEQLRARRSTLPVLVVSARDAVAQRVAGLDAGADDYLAKPFDLGELIARAKALIRRGKGAAHPMLTAVNVEVNTLEQTVRRAGSHVDLSPTEYRILEYLMHHPRKVVSKRELLEHLYDYNWEHHSNVIEAHVSNLRKKLDAAEFDAMPVIETLRGRGYRLAASPESGHDE